MNTGATAISLAYYGVFVVYFVLGVHAYRTAPKSRGNQLYLLLGLAISTWSFGYSMTAATHNYTDALVWARVSKIGELAAYGLFYLTISTHVSKGKTSVGSIVLVMFLMVVNIYNFVISDNYYLYYGLNKTILGYLDLGGRLVEQTFLGELFGIASFATTFTLSLTKLGFTYLRSDAKEERVEYILLFYSTLFLFVAILFFDAMIPAYTTLLMPNATVFFAFLPMVTLAFFINKGQQDQSVVKQDENELNAVLNINQKERVLDIAEFTLFASALVAFPMELYLGKWTDFRSVIFILLIPLVTAFCIRMIRAYAENRKAKDIWVNVLIGLCLFLFVFQYRETGGLTVWILPLSFIPLSMLMRSKGSLFVLILTSALATIAMFLMNPIYWGAFRFYDILKRLLVFVLLFGSAIYVNYLYRYRLRENEEQVRIQEKLVSITASFIDTDVFNFEEKMIGLIKNARIFMGADRMYVAMFSDDFDALNFIYEGTVENMYSLKNSIGSMSTSDIPWITEKMKDGEFCVINDIRKLPPEASAEQLLFKRAGMKSTMFMPIKKAGKPVGVIGVENLNEYIEYSETSRDMMRFIVDIVNDALDQVGAQERARYLAHYDPLTELPNRVKFKKLVEQHLREHPNESCAILYLDLDSFQYINDTVGHDGGDELLRVIANEIREVLRPSDIFSRFSGDEFCIMLADVRDRFETTRLVEGITMLFQTPKLVVDQEFFVSVSAGVSIYPKDSNDFDELVAAAEMALHEVKVSGKNKHLICTPEMRKLYHFRHRIAANLERGLDKGEIRMMYQPILNAKNQSIEAFEALMRWDCPELGTVYPSDFLPVVEEMGLNRRILALSVDMVCRQMRKWRDQDFEIKVAMNISVDQFKRPEIVDIFLDASQRYGIRLEYLVLEVSESIEYKSDIDILQRLKNIGLKISLHDFGSKHSSLSRISEMSVDNIKIDKSFVLGLFSNEKNKGITKSIIEIGRNLNISVTAMGVETEAQYKYLIENNVDYMQGNYFYRPMIEDTATNLLMFSQLNKKKSMEDSFVEPSAHFSSNAFGG